MIERLGKDIVVNGDVLPAADYYDGIDDPAALEADEARIDKIISGIDPKAPADRSEARALGQGVLFILDEEERTHAIIDSVNQHPSSQNVPPQQLSEIALEILHDYHQELEYQKGLKKRVNVAKAARGAWIELVRNLDGLNEYDRQQIALELGYSKDHFKDKTSRAESKPDKDQLREPDFRERQFKD